MEEITTRGRCDDCEDRGNYNTLWGWRKLQHVGVVTTVRIEEITTRCEDGGNYNTWALWRLWGWRKLQHVGVVTTVRMEKITTRGRCDDCEDGGNYNTWALWRLWGWRKLQHVGVVTTVEMEEITTRGRCDDCEDGGNYNTWALWRRSVPVVIAHVKLPFNNSGSFFTVCLRSVHGIVPCSVSQATFRSCPGPGERQLPQGGATRPSESLLACEMSNHLSLVKYFTCWWYISSHLPMVKFLTFLLMVKYLTTYCWQKYLTSGR